MKVSISCWVKAKDFFPTHFFELPPLQPHWPSSCPLITPGMVVPQASVCNPLLPETCMAHSTPSFIFKHLLKCHCCELVPWEADSSDVWHAAGIIGSALVINTYGKVGKTIGTGMEKLSGGTGLMTAWTCVPVSSRAKMACQSCPPLGQRD